MAGDRLAAVRVLGGGVDVPAAVEGGLGAVVLQLHHVQREPAASGHLVVALTHHKAARAHVLPVRAVLNDWECVCVCVCCSCVLTSA